MLGWVGSSAVRVARVVGALVLGACSPPSPEEVVDPDESDTSAGPTSTGSAVTGLETTTPGEVTSEASAAVDTTVAETTADGTSGSSGPSDCTIDGCDSNQECENGRCVEACGGTWGMGSYGYCLDELGTFDTTESCGAEHLCVYWGDPITATACALQDCTDACDCPAPPETGNAVVTCGQITEPQEARDCYLSCERGETCPEGMICAENGACTTEAPAVAMYGNCGPLAPDCEAPGFCVVADPGGESVCTQSCLTPADCPIPIPPGGNAILSCTDITPDEDGFECYASCIGFVCPDGMTCVNGTLCMWAP